MVRAFEAGERFAEAFPDPATIASGLRVPAAVGDFLILDAVRESEGAACAAPEADLVPWTQRAASLEGVALCPEAAACLAVLHSRLQAGDIAPDERVVVFNTGAAQKYVEALAPELPSLGPADAVDWGLVEGCA